MSMSLYHGCRIVTDSMGELTAVMERFRGEATILARQLMARRLAADTVEMLDDAAVRGKELPKNPLSKANKKLEEVYKKEQDTLRRSTDSFDYDFECQADLIFRDGVVYVLLHTEQKEYRALFLSMPEVEEYRVVIPDSTPSWGIPRDEWVRRQAAWKAVLDGNHGKPMGFRFRLIGDFPPHIKPEEVLAQVPPFEERVKRLANLALRDDWLAKRVPTDREDKEAVMRAVWREIPAYENWLRTAEGQNALADQGDRVRGLLKTDLTVVDLLGWDPAKYAKTGPEL